MNEPPAPAMIDQELEPAEGAFAASVAVVPHSVWSGPAFALVGCATVTVMGTLGEVVQLLPTQEIITVPLPLLFPATFDCELPEL